MVTREPRGENGRAPMDRDAGGAPDAEHDERRRRDAQLVERVRAGDQQAFADLYDVWFDRVHDLARRIVRDPETAAEVAQDTFLTAWQKLDTLDQPSSFGGWLLRIARNRALNRSAREQRSTAVGDETMAALESGGELVSAPAGFRAGERLARADDPAIAAEDHEVADLLWSAAEALGERDQTVLTLQLRYGMSPAEIGEVLGVNRNAANQMVHRVKGRLDSAVQARVLWDGERVRCERLEAELARAGVDGFGPEAVKIADKHAKRCDECGERRRLRLQPAALFGALPLLAAPQLVKQQVAAALAAEGVPVDPGRYAAGDPSGGTDGSGGGDAPTPDGGAVVDDPLAAAEPAPSGSGRSTQAALAAGVAGVLVVLGLVLYLLLGSSGRGDETVAAGAGEPAGGEQVEDDPAVEEVDELPDGPITTAPPETAATTTSIVPFPDFGLPPDAAGDEVEQPAPPPDPIQEFSLSPSTVSGASVYPVTDAPVLRWRVTPGYEVEVSGVGLAPVFASAGSRPICPQPPVPDWTVCPAIPGSYVYRLVVRQDGEVRSVRHLTLTIEP